MVGGDFFDKLVLGHGSRVVIDMKPLSLECGDSILTDVFEQK